MPILKIGFWELADFAGVWQSFMVRPLRLPYIWWIEFGL
jgi:hypothetical protein